MEPQLTQTQLDQVIAEAQRLTEYRQDNLVDAGQVREILQELNLPPEVLEDALAQVQRRQALAQQKRQQRIGLGIAGVALFMAIAIPGVWFWQSRLALGRVSAQANRITLAQDNGRTLTEIDRQIQPELYYRVTLKDVPIGQKLPLACDWVDPSGQVVKQNRYETKVATTAVWETHCRYSLNPGAPTGTWKVNLSLEGRTLDSVKFDVK